MATILEAKAVISAQDKTGAVFDQIAKKLNNLGKSRKAAAAVESMSVAMSKAREQLVAINRFDSTRNPFTAARQKFREAQLAVESAARAIKAADKPTRELEANLTRAQGVVATASRAYEKQKTALLENKRAMSDVGVPIGKAAAHQARLNGLIEKANITLEKQEKIAARSEARRLAVGGALAAGGAAVAHGVKHGSKAVLHTYREFDKERRFGKAVMGLSDDEQKPLVDQAIHMGATTKFNDVQVLEAQRELAARGVSKDTVLGMMQPAGSLGMAMDLKLPDAVKQMEGAIFGFKKKIDTVEDAMKSAKRTADIQVKAAKISGMTPEDISQAYKYGATSARLSGLSEETLLAFAGISKKANMGGDESGVAFRALVAAMQSPTAGAKTALLANGLNFKNYQKAPDSIPVEPFAEDVAAKYGVKLDKAARAALQKVFSNKDVLSDPAKFAPAVSNVLGETLGDGDAKSKKSIAGAANRYRASALGAIDSNAFMADLLKKIPGNLPLANALFGAKQGGRIATALGDPETFGKMLDELKNGSEGYSEKIAAERMSGFDGAVSRFEGAIKNLETAIGRGLDKDGKGGLLTGVTDKIGKGIQWVAEQDSGKVAAGAVGAGALGLAGAGVAGYKFLQIITAGAALTGSAAALDGAAAALMAAAKMQGGGAAAGGAASTAAKGAAGGASGGAAAGGVTSAFTTAGAAALPFMPYAAIAFGSVAALKMAVPDEDVGLTAGERLNKYRGGSLTDARRRAFNVERARMGLPLADPEPNQSAIPRADPRAGSRLPDWARLDAPAPKQAIILPSALGDIKTDLARMGMSRADSDASSRLPEWARLGAPAPKQALIPPSALDEIKSIVQGGNTTAEPARAEIIGNASLDTTITVNPSSDFWTKVDQRIDNKVNAFSRSGVASSGSSGSTGRSMPEAGPPQ